MCKEDFKELDELRWVTINGNTQYFGKVLKNKDETYIAGIEITPDSKKHVIHNWFKRANLAEEDIVKLEGNYSIQIKTLTEKEQTKCQYWASQMQYIKSKAIKMLENKFFDESS